MYIYKCIYIQMYLYYMKLYEIWYEKKQSTNLETNLANLTMQHHLVLQDLSVGCLRSSVSPSVSGAPQENKAGFQRQFEFNIRFKAPAADHMQKNHHVFPSGFQDFHIMIPIIMKSYLVKFTQLQIWRCPKMVVPQNAWFIQWKIYLTMDLGVS